MALTVSRGAPVADLSAMLERDRDRKPTVNPMFLARTYAGGSHSWTYRNDAGAVVACSGLWLLRDNTATRQFETWLCCHPEAAKHMLEFVRLAQLTLQSVAQDGPIDVRALVALGHRPGQRLARLVGFAPEKTERGFEHWRAQWVPS